MDLLWLWGMCNSIWAGEWFFTSMSSFMMFQITSNCESLITLWAAERLFTSINLLCCFIPPKCLNFLSHCKQLNGYSSVWVLSCSFKSQPSANFLSHFVQLNGSSPAWLLLWCFNSSSSENLLSHCRHMKGSAPWVLSCSFIPIRKWEFLVTLWTAICRTMRFCRFYNETPLHWWKRKWLLLFFQERHTTFDVQMPNMAWEMPKFTGFYTRNCWILL